MFLRICVLVALGAFISTSLSSPHHRHVHVLPSCEEFIKATNLTNFNESLAIGTWYRLHKTKEVCEIISFVRNEERKNLTERFGDHVKGVNWDLLTLKLELPCNSSKEEDEKRIIYLEKVADNGTYISIPIHSKAEKEKENPATVSLNPTALRIIDGKYLAMLDCDNRFVFVLGRDPNIPDQLSDEVKKLMEA